MLDVPANYTIGFWFRPATAPAGVVTSRLCGIRDTSTIDIGLSWDHPSGGFQGTWFFRDGIGGYASAQYVSALTANVWAFLACTWNGTVLTSWLNGISDATSTPGTTPAIGSAVFYHGTNSNVGLGSTVSPLGVIGETAVWDVALTAPELMFLRQGNPLVNYRPSAMISRLPLIGAGAVEVDTALRGYTTYSVVGTQRATDWWGKTRSTRPVRPPLWALSPPAGGGGGGFQAAWAINSNVLIQPGARSA